MNKCICVIILLFLPILVSSQTLIDTQKIDEWSNTNCDDWMARIEGLAIEVGKDKSSQGYIIFYGGRKNISPYRSTFAKSLPRRGEAYARAAVLKSHLINTRKVEGNRIVLVNGGFRETWTVELWVVPKGAIPPLPTPTVKESAIRFRKGKIGKQEYTCWEL
jgi:hypothetical protein